MTSKSPILSVRSLRARYGQIEVLHDVSLEIHQGEIISLLGANGAGKSTTLMCISGIHANYSGEIAFDGTAVESLAPHKRVALGIAQVPEGRRIFPRLTVHENLLLGAYLHTLSPQVTATEERVYDLFPVLKDRRSQFGGTLSGGEQQMLAIGRALMSRPAILLLDEPSMGIAPILVRKIFDTLATLNREGMTILLIEQNAHLALSISHRAYVLETGAITLQGQASQLANDPRVREAYLGE
jgi:branched-chain amino acid transport system ATP-binding protein